MVATVEDGRVTKLRPDADHPLSKGYACPKGIAMLDVQNDPDRVLHPLKKNAKTGEFERVSWIEALDDIGARLNAIIDRNGKKSVAWYMGNPGAFSHSHPLWSKGFVDGLGSPHYYTAGSQDVNNRFAASALLYGSPLVVPIPDLNRTKFLFMTGANPMVSHGSVLTAPRIREQLLDITARGGRVVVVDPRRTETARQFEHVPITPDTDAWLLLSMLQVIFAEGLEDKDFVATNADGAKQLADLARPFAPEETESRTGIPAETVRELARAMANPGSAAYGRTGSCLGRFGTLVAFLIDALAAVTGNLDAPGGSVFGRPPVALDDVGERAGLASYGKVRSRFGNFPDVIGNLPASLLPKEITTPGELQIRALFVSAGNPVLSCPDGDALEEALDQLELCVSLDFYVNETNRHADYILPSPTFYERDDLPIAFLGFYTTPFVQYTQPVVEPAGEAREEWEVIDEIAKRIGIVPFPVKLARMLGRLPGLRPTPRRLVDMLLRTGPNGDLFGLRRGGLNLSKLEKEPHGLVLDEHIATGVLSKKVRTKNSKLQLAPAEIAAEVQRLSTVNGADPDYPLRLIGLRELRSHNSWMHNAPLLMRGGRTHALRVHPSDAEAHGLVDGGEARLASKSGAVVVPVKVTDEMTPGTVALPHGWGHKGGWKVANDAGGVNVNLLASSEPEDLEPLAGMAFLNGIPVKMEPVRPSDGHADADARPAVPALDT
jgi:formate dehydrogenase